MTTDVAEREATQTATEDVSTGATEARESTDTRQDNQTDTGAEQEPTDSGQKAPPDPREQRLTALAEAEREEAERRGEERALSRIEQGQTQQQRDAARQKLRQAFPTAQQKIDQVFSRAVDEYGNQRPLTPAEQTEVKNALAGYNLVAGQVATDEVADIVKEVAYGLLSKDGQTAFSQATAQDTPLPEYLTAWVEHAALNTKAVKSMTLDEAVKASSKVKRELAAAKLEEYDRGRDDGRNDPPGTSPDRGRAAERTPPGTKSYADLEIGYGDGSNTKAEDAEYIKLRDARKKSG